MSEKPNTKTRKANILAILGVLFLCVSLIMYLGFHTEEVSFANKTVAVFALWGSAFMIWSVLVDRQARKEASG